MQDTSRPSDFASEAASQRSVQGEALGASGSLHSQKSGQSDPDLCLQLQYLLKSSLKAFTLTSLGNHARQVQKVHRIQTL